MCSGRAKKLKKVAIVLAKKHNFRWSPKLWRAIKHDYTKGFISKDLKPIVK